MATVSATSRRVRMSWVIVTAVAPISVTISRIRVLMTPAMIGSSPAVGSSKNRIGGSPAMARARPTRFCIPPDSSAGKRSATSGPRPTRASLSTASARASALDRRWRPRIRRKAMFCQTGSESNKAPPWNSIPTCSASTCGRASVSPAMVTLPASGGTRPSRHLSSTDLPVPDPPITTRLWPLGTAKLIPRSTAFGPKDLRMSRASIMRQRTLRSGHNWRPGSGPRP